MSISIYTPEKKVFLKLLVLFLIVFFSSQNLTAQNHRQKERQAVVDLLKRILPARHVSNFNIEFIECADGKDVFEVEPVGDKIVLRGNNGVSVASALNYYLENYANCQYTWNTEALELPKELPVIDKKIRKTTPYKYRYYLNYCTFNYTMSWWDWERWQREIDWMALHGINMPLALTGQNIIWQRIYKRLGFTDDELQPFFSGPAYFNWFWMGNLDGWGGPLPQSWMESHEELQKQILARERSLGMTPVLPAFTGHVPPTLKKKFPLSNVKTTNWSTFPAVSILDPSDSLFPVIGEKFLTELIKTYGTDHFYSADTFNENRPPTNEPQFLHNISEKIFDSMRKVDNKATWIMQGWLFHFQRNFWKDEQIQALLSGVPDDGMILLDLWSEKNPMWGKTHSYYGKPWIWCMLHNFGGNNSLYGRMDHIAQEPVKTFKNENSGNMAGIGLTPEAIEQNPVIYELMLHNVWNKTPIDVDKWLRQYIRNRYGNTNKLLESAWDILRKTAYADSITSGGTESIIVARPTFEKNAGCVDTQSAYDTKKLVSAWEKMVSAADEFETSDAFRYDLVDLTRQVLANYGNELQQSLALDLQNNNFESYNRKKDEFLRLFEDMDKLMATRSEFLLGNWLEDAKHWGTTKEESAIFERNARNLITLWGDTKSRLHEYSWRHWAGLINDFYKVRWERFFEQVDKSVKEKTEFDQSQFEKEIADWEWQWVNQQNIYSTYPKGDEISVVKLIYQSYRRRLK